MTRGLIESRKYETHLDQPERIYREDSKESEIEDEIYRVNFVPMQRRFVDRYAVSSEGALTFLKTI
jgi:hypothetical protein